VQQYCWWLQHCNDVLELAVLHARVALHSPLLLNFMKWRLQGCSTYGVHCVLFNNHVIEGNGFIVLAVCLYWLCCFVGSMQAVGGAAAVSVAAVSRSHDFVVSGQQMQQ
jgi:hypothetical protein